MDISDQKMDKFVQMIKKSCSQLQSSDTEKLVSIEVSLWEEERARRVISARWMAFSSVRSH